MSLLVENRDLGAGLRGLLGALRAGMAATENDDVSVIGLDDVVIGNLRSLAEPALVELARAVDGFAHAAGASRLLVSFTGVLGGGADLGRLVLGGSVDLRCLVLLRLVGQSDRS